LASSNEAFDSEAESSLPGFDQLDDQRSRHRSPTPRATLDRLFKPALLSAAALVCALTIGGGTIAALTKTVSISVDGTTRQVTTLAGSVQGALTAAGLNVNAHDTLAPVGAAAISDGSRIALNRGRPFTVTVDGRKQTIWTTAKTVDEALAEIGRDPADYQLSANRSRPIPLGGMQVTAASLHTVSVAGSHVKPARITSPARTVAELLHEQGVALGRNDRVSPALDTVLSDGVTVTVRTLPTVVIADGTGTATWKVSELKTVGDLLLAQRVTVGKDDVVTPSPATRLTQNLKITITRVGYQLVTKAQAVPQPADQTVEDDSMDKGTSWVSRQGQPGVVQITYRMKVVNRKAGAPAEVSRKAVSPAVATITHVGTYVAPVVVQTTPTSAPTTSSATLAPVAGDTTPTITSSATPGNASSSSSSTSDEPSSTETSSSEPSTSTTDPGSAAASTSPGDGSAGTGTAGYYDDPSHWSVNWDAIARCESTNNWSTNTGNRYYGGLQFDYGTWLGAGGGVYADRADHASKSEQIAIAEKVYAARGLQPWACGSAAG